MSVIIKPGQELDLTPLYGCQIVQMRHIIGKYKHGTDYGTRKWPEIPLTFETQYVTK